MKRDTGHVPLGLDAIRQGPGVAFPLIQSQEVHIAAAGFDHSSVDSCSADTGALDTRRQKRILLVDMPVFISSSIDLHAGRFISCFLKTQTFLLYTIYTTNQKVIKIFLMFLKDVPYAYSAITTGA